MKKLRFLANCPGCGDSHVGIQCKKPTRLTVTITKSVCDNCESTTIFMVGLPKERSKGQVAYSPMKFLPSDKLGEILNFRKSLFIKAPEVEAQEPSITDTNTTAVAASLPFDPQTNSNITP